MAQLNHSTRSTPEPNRTLRGSFRLEYFQTSTCISTATIAYGDVVQFDVNVATANHRIVKASTMANVPNVISTAIVGIAAEADESSVSAGSPGVGKIGVYVAERDSEFIFPSKTAGAAYDSSLVGLRKAIGYDSTNSMFYVDNGNSTAGDATLIITGLGNDAGTTNGLLIGKFISTNVARLISGAF
jgi:hypothetical protein